jgi:hypothetical protein
MNTMTDKILYWTFVAVILVPTGLVAIAILADNLIK